MRQLRNRYFRLFVALGLVVVVALGITRVVRAVEFDDDGTVAAGEVIDDDLFISAETVTIDGVVNGDLFASGSTVVVNGEVNGNLIVSGAEVEINGLVAGSLVFGGQMLLLNGEVGGTVYAGGSQLTLASSANVGRNVFFGGFSLDTEQESVIGRDLIMGGSQARLAGEVDGDVQADVAAFELSGYVGGDVRASVEEPGEGPPIQFLWPGLPPMMDPGIRVAESAQVAGTLTYISPVPQEEAIRASPVGGIVYEQAQLDVEPQADLATSVGPWLLARLRDLITLLVLGGIAVWRIPALLGRLADKARTALLPSAGWGALSLIAGYVGILFAGTVVLVLGFLLGVVTLGGLARTVFGIGFSSLGLVFASFSLAVAYGSKLVVAHWIGNGLLRRFSPQHAGSGWGVILGVFVYMLLRSIPFLGWVVGALVTLVGLGAMWLLFRERRRAPAVPAGVSDA
ncbi:MAG: polymer-forming cytoskeletal protein [Anaerolineae bacterium]|nr:polymer-forming cytoskeletal protein [Anaerolineae bacterium]